MDALDKCGDYDTYHLPGYHLLAEYCGEGKAYLCFVECKKHYAALPLLLRNISDIEGLSSFDSVDATSVYGYPGVVTSLCASHPDAEVLKRYFHEKLRGFFLDRNVMSFFSRLNPLIESNWLFCGFSELVKHAPTVTIDLSQSDQNQLKGMTKGHRYDIRKAQKLGVRVIEDRAFKKLDDFIKIYSQTMARNQALNYYFFSTAYFDKLLSLLKNSVKLLFAEYKGKIISASMFLVTNHIIQYHLSGTLEKYMKYSGAKAILDHMRDWGARNGIKWYHLGGGLGSSEDSSLYRFKAGFSKLRFPFYVTKLITNDPLYRKAVSARIDWLTQNNMMISNSAYFPLYRAPCNILKPTAASYNLAATLP